jgi:hypothetical protein
MHVNEVPFGGERRRRVGRTKGGLRLLFLRVGHRMHIDAQMVTNDAVAVAVAVDAMVRRGGLMLESL